MAVVSLARWGQVWVLSALVATTLLGAWRLPGHTGLLSSSNAPTWLGLLGAVVVQLKCWGTTLVIAATRWLVPRLHVRQALSLCWTWLVPLSGLSLVGTLLWRQGLHREWLGPWQHWMSAVLVTLCAAAAGFVTLRVAAALKAPTSRGGISPWL